MTLILMALLMAVLVLIVGLVIDYSFVRNTRQDNKATIDAAVAAGVRSLAPAGTSYPWSGTCAALSYLKANQPDQTFAVSYYDGSEPPNAVTSPSDPCTDAGLLATPCTPDSPTTWAKIEAHSSDYRVELLSGYSLPDTRFPEDLAPSEYNGDNGDDSLGGCDHLAAVISKADDAYFGGVAGRSGYDTTTRSVGRVRIGQEGDGVPAFLMLERKDCDVINQQVGSGGGIVVQAIGSEPGAIHSDSSGFGSCTGNPSTSANARTHTVFSSTLGGGPGIDIQGVDGAPGILSTRALSSAGNSVRAVATAEGVRGERVEGDVVSRQPVDDKYNPSSPGTPAISLLHSASYTDALRTSAPSGWTEVPSTDCSGFSGTVTGLNVFVNCSGAFSPADVTFSNAEVIVFRGRIDLGNNQRLHMPVAKRIVVGGSATSGGVYVTGTGRLGINSLAFARTDTKTDSEGVTDESRSPDPGLPGTDRACVGREGPAHTRTATMTIFGGATGGSTPGALNLGGYTAMCQTAVYLAGPKAPTYTRQTSVDTTYDATCLNTPLIKTPCPKDDVYLGAELRVPGGYVRWSAPNQRTSQPPVGNAGVEDLALWGESSSTASISSGGRLDGQGVFFAPNAAFDMSSPSKFTPRDAQFIARRLKLLQGTLLMRPTTSNNVLVEILLSTGLVR